MALLPGSSRGVPALAWYWNVRARSTKMDRPCEDPKSAVSSRGDLAQPDAGVLSQNKIAVNDFATAHQKTLTRLTHSDSESDRSVPQNELNAKLSKEAIDVSAHLANIKQNHFKPRDPPLAATPKESKPTKMMETSASSSSAPRRAPTAQMVPLGSNAAVATSPAATAPPGPLTTRHIGPDSSPINIESPQVFFPAAALSSLPLPPILPSTPTATSKTLIPKKCISKKTPRILLTPAPATAPCAFKDTALAAHVQNTKFLSPVKQRSNGIKKRQNVRSSSPPKSVSTPASIPEEKRRRGRPRARVEEQPLQENRQHRSPVQPSTPIPRTGGSTQTNASVSAPSNHALQQQQAVTLNVNGESTPRLCSEEPRLWPGRGDHVTSLLHFDSKPETIHSEPIQACANHAAHQDAQEPHGHGVCATCRQGARRHIRATRPELLRPAWWPLCKTCGDFELLYTDPKINGCSCGKIWLCFSCQTQEIERRSMKNNVEAEFRRRTFIRAGMDGNVKTVAMGWACECGAEIGPDATLMKCIGCQGMLVGKLDFREAMARENALTKNALAWT